MAAARCKKLLRFMAVFSSDYPMLSTSTYVLDGISFYDHTTFVGLVTDWRRHPHHDRARRAERFGWIDGGSSVGARRATAV